MTRNSLQSQKTTNDEFSVRKTVEFFVGSQVEVRTTSGRNRSAISGIISDACSCVFIVQFKNSYETIRTVSFSYVEVLIGEVEVVVIDGNRKIMISDVYSDFAAYNDAVAVSS